jgi:acyl-homoserine lactone acylase PvdQ
MCAATDARELRSAAMGITAPALNIVYAATDGHFGYQSVGLVPRRNIPTVVSTCPRTACGRSPGGRATTDGYLSVGDLPEIADPAEGFLVAATRP